MINKICENCHQMFLAKGWKYKTCSRNCDTELRNKKKFIKNIHCCNNCKKIFSDKRFNKNKFCSLKCSCEYDVLNRYGNGLDNRLEKKCKGCKKLLPNNKEYFHVRKYEKYERTESVCKSCVIIRNEKNRKKRENMGIYYDRAYEYKKRRIKRKILKAKELGISYESWCFILTLKKEILTKRKLLKDLKSRLNKFNPRLIKKDLNWYKEYYKISINSWKELTKDKPNEDALIYRIRYKYDTEFNLKERLRNQLTKQKKKYPNLDYAIRQAASKNQNTKYLDILGYSKEELKNHLEKKFTKDMTWEAFRNGEIHIDHIKPQSLFNLKDINDIKECWSLNNLQPLWAKDNIAKSNKYKER
jgi:hypothetical protein